MGLQTNVKVKEKNARSLDIKRFAGKQSHEHKRFSVLEIFVDSAR